MVSKTMGQKEYNLLMAECDPNDCLLDIHGVEYHKTKNSKYYKTVRTALWFAKWNVKEISKKQCKYPTH